MDTWGDELEEQTLETLKTASFNKMRMCVLPKTYSYNKNEPQYYPFGGSALKDWDFTRCNPLFFRHLEMRVVDSLELGIEADIILFSPYDRLGFSEMDPESDYRLIYFGEDQPVAWFYGKPKQGRFKVDVIDTWNMTITPQDRIYENDEEIPLPGRPYLAIRILGVN
ncbi:MAG: hypothetical protein AMJ65_09385 [Phycisphaerae bacterium SG8_4]|nr:MAG: hypothetical protein AMJ65_09385 [Phycisphaerae bacterium SG8_4]